jgi:hypothetical protein
MTDTYAVPFAVIFVNSLIVSFYAHESYRISMPQQTGKRESDAGALRTTSDK